MASQPALDLAHPLPCRIGKITYHPSALSRAASILASHRQNARPGWQDHCRQILASIQKEKGQ